jgi:streptogramin lyase
MSLPELIAFPRRFTALSLRVFRFETGNRSIWISRFALLAVLLVATTMLPSPAQAQATFNWAQRTLVSGIRFPAGVALDTQGDLYVADPVFANTVDEVLAVDGAIPASPVIRSLGSGFSDPFSLTVDGSGNVYVADANHSAVKEILAVGGSIPSSPTIVTLGSGFSAPYDVAVDSNGDVFVADGTETTIKEILAVNGVIPASPTIVTLGGGFDFPAGVAVDRSGNVFVVDNNHGAIKEIPASCIASANNATCVLTLATGFAYPQNVAVDASGNVYVGGGDSSTVNEILAVGGSIPPSPTIKVLGSGFNVPWGVAVDGQGNVFIGDTGLEEVFEISLENVDFGQEPIGSTSAVETFNFAIDAGTTVGSIGVLTQGAAGLDFANASGSTCTATTYAVTTNCAVNVTFTPRFSGTRDGAVVIYDDTGNAISTVYLQGTGVGPQVIYSPALISTPVSGIGSGSDPVGVAVDGSGNLYDANLSNAVKKIPLGCTSASCVTTLGGGFRSPSGVAVDGGGNVYVADQGNNAVKEIPPGCASASCVTALGGGFSGPMSVAVDGSGNVYVADFDNNAVKEMPPGCASTSCVTTLGGGFSYPRGVAVDGSGNVYVGDTQNGAVKEMPPGCASTNCVTTLGEGFDFPAGVAVDGSRNVYVVDYSNSGLYEIGRATPPSLTFPSTDVNATSATQTVTIANAGNAPLNFTGLSYPADFPEAAGDANPCASSTILNENAVCDLPIDFTPQNGGSLSESVTLTDNALNVAGAQQMITVSGTGIGKGRQTITFPAIAEPVYVGGTVTLAATASSGLAVSYVSVYPAQGVCSITNSGGVWSVNLLAVGSCSVEALQWGNEDYTPAKAFQNFYVHSNGADH